MGEFHAGLLFEQRRREMLSAADAAGADVQLARIGFRMGDQVRHAAYRQGGIDHRDRGADQHQRDRREVIRHMEWKTLVEKLVGRMCADRGDDISQPIRSAARNELRADIAGGTDPVLDHHGLAERPADRIGDQSTRCIGAAPGRETDDEAHRPVGPPGNGGLCEGRQGRQQRHGAERAQQSATIHEGVS